MNDNLLIKGMLSIVTGLLAVVDVENKRIMQIHDGTVKLDEDISYDDFANIIAEHFNLVKNFESKLVKFMDNLDPDKNIFDMPVEYDTVDGKLLSVRYRASFIENGKMLLYVDKNKMDLSKELDPLTKCHNKSYIADKCNAAINSGTEFALVIIDIDYFKQFNDTYGHMFGDVVLIEVVSAIKKYMGNKGLLARIGGDEFLAFVNIENDYQKLREFLYGLYQAVLNISNATISRKQVTITIGAVAYPKDGDNFELLFRKADKALYRGKGKGRKCFIIYLEEKCGKVTLDEDFEESLNQMNKITESGIFSCIRSVIESLNANRNVDISIDEVLNIVGNHYQIERASLTRVDPNGTEIKKQQVWFAPYLDEKTPLACSETNVEAWREEMGASRMLKVTQFKITDGFRMNDEFVKDKSVATLAFDLMVDGKIFGLLRFDILTKPRHWQEHDIHSLTVISKIIAIHLSRDYMQNLHYKELYFDKLTDCFNFNKWYLDVGNFIETTGTRQYSLMEIAIQDYRNIANIIGVKASNDILKLMANSLLSWVEKENIIFCRRTEDAFLVLIPKNDEETVNDIYESVLESVEIENFHKNTLIVNTGVFVNDGTVSLDDAVDKAIMARKEKSKFNSITYFNEKIYEENRIKTSLELHMHNALKNNEFLLYLQPKVDPNTNQIVGAEALTRWYYKFEKLIAPYLFIPLFEETGFIVNLDYRVFENVCAFQRNVIDSGKKPVPISVNVSRYVNDYDEYLNTIETIREKYDISPELIEIEITEGMFFANTQEISSFMDKLHICGYTISMDDFGSGYSNFASLAKLKFDVIKLDKSFIGADGVNEKESTILKAMVSLVKSLHMKALCEGVEEKEAVDFLSSIGIDLIQGYYYDKPLPYEEFSKKYIK